MAKGKKTNNKSENKNVKKSNTKTEKDIKNQTPISGEQNNEIIRLVKIVLIVTAIFAVFYVVTLLVTKKSDEVKHDREQENKTVEKAEIQYENIMIGTMLNENGTSYVLILETDDNRSEEYESLIETIKSNEDAPNIYKANLTDSFNKTYLGKEENYYVSDISEFRVKGTTLVKIVDGKVDAVFDNYDAIKNKLTELA